MEVGAIVARLRETQRARVEPLPVGDHDPEAAALVERGVAALESGIIEESQQLFGQAIAVSRDAAVREFLYGWPRSLERRLVVRFRDAPMELASTEWGRTERIDLEDLIVDLAASASDATVRRLELQLLRGATNMPLTQRLGLLQMLLTERGEPETWQADEALVVAMEAMETYDPLRDPPEMAYRASLFLERAIVEVDADTASEAFDLLVAVANRVETPNWCLEILRRVAELRAETKFPSSIPFSLAHQLRFSEQPTDLAEALAILEREEVKLHDTELGEEQRRTAEEYVALTKAEASASLWAARGDPKLAAESEQILISLRASSDSRLIRQLASEQLGSLWLDLGRVDEARTLLEEALRDYPGNSTIHLLLMLAAFLEGDVDLAAGAAVAAIEVSGEGDTDALFVAALGQIMTRHGHWELLARQFIQRDHPYRDYIAMLLYAHAEGHDRADAREVLVERWARIGPRRSDWDERLRHGDEMVWREKLIGYFLGEVDADAVFGDLEDDARYERSAIRHISLPRRGLLCEGYFYDAMLAKAEGDDARMGERLQKVVDTGHVNYIEHKLAIYLLGQSR
jgi:lipoprotein NlpI